MLAQNGKQETGNQTQSNAKGNPCRECLKSRVTEHTLADKGGQRSGEQGDVDMVFKRSSVNYAEQPGSQNTGPDIQNVHAKETETNRQEKCHQGQGVHLRLGKVQDQNTGYADQTGVEEGGSNAAQSKVIHGQLGRGSEDDTKSLKKLRIGA